MSSERRSDGFGTQFFISVLCIVLSESQGCDYVYYPIESMEHNYDNDPDFINKVEDTMNIKNNYTNKKDLNNRENVKILATWDIINEFHRNIEFYASSDSMKRVKEIFWQNKDRNVFKNGKINIAIHIRRPNNHDNRVQGTEISDSYFLNVINVIREKYKDNLLFHIYSQGEEDSFKKVYTGEDIRFHINQDLFTSFVELVGAEILVTSPSSFSYLPALLTDGEVYYLPYWNWATPLKKFIIINKPV